MGQWFLHVCLAHIIQGSPHLNVQCPLSILGYPPGRILGALVSSPSLSTPNLEFPKNALQLSTWWDLGVPVSSAILSSTDCIIASWPYLSHAAVFVLDEEGTSLLEP